MCYPGHFVRTGLGVCSLNFSLRQTGTSGHCFPGYFYEYPCTFLAAEDLISGCFLLVVENLRAPEVEPDPGVRQAALEQHL